jgi:hypothetical protein
LFAAHLIFFVLITTPHPQTKTDVERELGDSTQKLSTWDSNPEPQDDDCG